MNDEPAKPAAGFALVLVLWTLLLLSILGLSLMRESSATYAQADADFTTTRGRLIADGAINRALASLLDPHDPVHWSLDGAPQSVALGEERIEVMVESETGKFDLNTTPAPALAALFTAQGVAPADAETIADYIVAWRSDPRPGSDDPDEDYRRAGRPYSPRMAPFRSVGELRLVLGMTDALQAALAPVLTVYSGNPAIDRGVASEPVLRLLSEAGDTLADGQLTARAAGQGAGANRAAAAGEVVTISARFTGRRVTHERHAVIRIGGDRQDPYKVLAWQ